MPYRWRRRAQSHLLSSRKNAEGANYRGLGDLKALSKELPMNKQDRQDVLIRLLILPILLIHLKRNYFERLAVKSWSPKRSLCDFPFMESPSTVAV